MESQKPRRKTKWLSKLLHREDSGSTSSASRKTNPAHEAGSNLSTHGRKPSPSCTLTKSPSGERKTSPPEPKEATAVTVEVIQSTPSPKARPLDFWPSNNHSVRAHHPLQHTRKTRVCPAPRSPKEKVSV